MMSVVYRSEEAGFETRLLNALSENSRDMPEALQDKIVADAVAFTDGNFAGPLSREADRIEISRYIARHADQE